MDICNHVQCDAAHELECRVRYYCSQCHPIINDFVDCCPPFPYLFERRHYIDHLAVIKPRLGSLDHRPLRRDMSDTRIKEDISYRLHNLRPGPLNNLLLLFYADDQHVLEGSWNIVVDDVTTLNLYWEHFVTDFCYSAVNIDYIEINCRLIMDDDRIEGGVISIVNADLRDLLHINAIADKIRQVATIHSFEQQLIFYKPKYFSDVGVREKDERKDLQTYIYTTSLLPDHSFKLLFSAGVEEWLGFYKLYS